MLIIWKSTAGSVHFLTNSLSRRIAEALLRITGGGTLAALVESETAFAWMEDLRESLLDYCTPHFFLDPDSTPAAYQTSQQYKLFRSLARDEQLELLAAWYRHYATHSNPAWVRANKIMAHIEAVDQAFSEWHTKEVRRPTKPC